MQNDLHNFGILWDMDGILLDTGELHFLSWQKALAEVGREYTHEEYLTTFGMNNTGTMQALFGMDVPPAFIDQVSERKEILFREWEPGNVSVFPGVLEWLERFSTLGARQAIASSGPIENLEVLVAKAGFGAYFDAIVSGTHMPGKPKPDVFLKAAEALGVLSEKCLVIEDSVAGVQAARNAGMKCLAVTNTYPREKLVGAAVVVDSLIKLSEKQVFELLVQ